MAPDTPDAAGPDTTDGMSLKCLNDAINASGTARKVLAADLGMSEAQFSKLMSGAQGCRIDLIDRLPKEIRIDYFRRRAEAEAAEDEKELVVVKQAAHAVIELLGALHPRMAKAGLANDRGRRVGDTWARRAGDVVHRRA